MGTTRSVRLHWQEMVWYAWIVSSALVLAGSVLAYLLGFDGLAQLGPTRGLDGRNQTRQTDSESKALHGQLIENRSAG